MVGRRVLHGITVVMLGCAVLGAPSVASAAGCADNEKFAVVSVSIGESGISVVPDEVTIYRAKNPKAVCWIVSGIGEGESLKIGRKNSEDETFGSGEWKLIKDGEATSGTPKGTGNARFNYGAWLSRDGKVVKYKDPVIIIIGSGGGG